MDTAKIRTGTVRSVGTRDTTRIITELTEYVEKTLPGQLGRYYFPQVHLGLCEENNLDEMGYLDSVLWRMGAVIPYFNSQSFLFSDLFLRPKVDTYRIDNNL